MTIVNALRRLVDQTCLTTNLCSDFIVGKTSCGEDGDLLSSGNGVHGVDGGDTGGDHFFGVDLFGEGGVSAINPEPSIANP